MKILYSILGILIPFIGTTLGSSFVLFMKKNMNNNIQKTIIGIASGVMIAASIFSLIIPSVEMATISGVISWLPATIGLIVGMLFLIVIYKYTDKLERKNKKKKIDMVMFSVTLHNIPEGMAVGVAFVGALANAGITIFEALILAIGIAIQNIPEGAIITIPMQLKNATKKKAFIYGILSGVVEPIAAILTILLINVIKPILPYLLSFAAGAMIFVVIEELIPEIHSGKKSMLGVIGFFIGFIIMMILDIALG